MTAATTINDRSTLPQWKGHAVPWVTRWSGEVNDDKLQISLEVATKTAHVNYTDGNEDRDDHGVMWKREGIGRQGEPQYSELNTYRQRASMNKRLCQVCGTKINERPIRWLLGRGQLIDPKGGIGDNGGGPLVISPPTCSPCIPLALELCPFLKAQGYAIVKVLEYERWGVMGEAIDLNPETLQYRDLRGIFLPYKDSPIPLSAVAGFQQVVQFTKFVIEKSYDS